MLAASSAPTQPLIRVSLELGPTAGSCAGFPEDEYPLLERWPLSQQLRAQGSRRAITQKEPLLGLPMVSPWVTSGLADLWSGLLQTTADVLVSPLLSKGEETDPRSLSAIGRLVR